MMTSDERKIATSSLIPLEIDPASILSLSKGIIFDTIVHNVEYTLNNRRTDVLPWKLSGMSLICDSSRNKKYMQKLQKMQCVRSVICTQIYHSKLVKTERGVLATPGRKIVIPFTAPTRLTGIIVCRSIDELLYMESSNTETVHFVQYKLLSYERLATRELVNGPKLPSVGGKIIKTVFDFELTQNNGFPRQLLPVAIITFSRQNDFDLCLSIRNFLKLDEHKIFDKSYLVTSTNTEFDRLREEQERKEDAEAEQELPWERIQRRQPLADLSRKSTDTGNARPSSISEPSLRVPPLKIKISRPEKPLKLTIPILPVDSKFQCLLKLDRVILSQYNISNLPSSNSINSKTKSFTIVKPHEHHKPLKRLTNSEFKKRSPSLASESSKEKRDDESMSIRSSTSDITVLLTKDKINKGSTSISSNSPMYQPKLTNQKPTVEKTIVKKKIKRPVLPSEYICSLLLSPIDLSMYDLDLPAIINILPMDVESTATTVSPSSSTPSEQQTESMSLPVELENIQSDVQPMSTVEQENVHEREEEILSDNQQFDDANTNIVSPILNDEFLTPEMNEPIPTPIDDSSPSSTDEVLLPTINEPISTVIDEAFSLPIVQIIDEVIAEVSSELLPIISDETLPESTNEIISTISNEENTKSRSPSPPYTAFSPDLPPLDDDPVLFSIENSQISAPDTSDTIPQDCIIIVPCSDDDDDMDDDENDRRINNISNDIDDNKIIEFISSPTKPNTSPVLLNPSLTRVLMSTSRLNSHRSSTSSSCSSISTSILHNQSPRTPLHLTEILLPQKIFNKQQKLPQSIVFNRFNLCIPLLTQEPLIDPRLIYRLQTITTDLRWPSPCNQCSISAHLPSLFTSSTQMIQYDRKCSSDYTDPRRESLKSAILNSIYERIKILIPNIFIINSNEFQHLLFEQTIFNTNCSLHLEYLLHKIKINDDMNFFHMIKNNDEFQLSPFLLQLIFN